MICLSVRRKYQTETITKSTSYSDINSCILNTEVNPNDISLKSTYNSLLYASDTSSCMLITFEKDTLAQLLLALSCHFGWTCALQAAET